MSMIVTWGVVGSGRLFVYRNGVQKADIGSGQTVEVIYQPYIDTYGYVAIPNSGYEFVEMCGNNFCVSSLTHTALLDGSLQSPFVATFKKSTNPPPPPPPPPPPSENGEGMGLLLPAVMLGFLGYYLFKGRKK